MFLVSLEQYNRDLIFKLSDLLCQGRLGDVKSVCSARIIQFLGRHIEDEGRQRMTLKHSLQRSSTQTGKSRLIQGGLAAKERATTLSLCNPIYKMTVREASARIPHLDDLELDLPENN